MGRRGRRVRGLVVTSLAGVLLAAATARLRAHPMPNAVITIATNHEGTRLDVAIPLADLRLAFPSAASDAADLLHEPQRSALIAYLEAHSAAQSRGHARIAFVVQALALSEAVDPDVGRYQELRAHLFAATSPAFNPYDFTLTYDAVIHQVPTQYARVRLVRPRPGIPPATDEEGQDVGVIRFDFATNRVVPVRVTAPPPPRSHESWLLAMLGALLVGLSALVRRRLSRGTDARLSLSPTPAVVTGVAGVGAVHALKGGRG